MDNAQKAIMIGVGLFITIIIIAAVMLITGMGQDMINSSTSQVSNISSSLQAQLTSQYDETTLTGSQVISAIKANNTTDGMVLVVRNASNTDQNYGRSRVAVTGGGTLSTTGTSNIAKVEEAKNSGNAALNQQSVGLLTNANDTNHYVAPTSKYTAHLIKISDSVVGIYFVKQ